MANTALIPVFTGTLADTTVQLCDARALHAFMHVLRDFSDWIKGRIRKYGFVEGIDFTMVKLDSPDLGNQKRGGDRRSVDYHLTLDMAKELSMVENNDMGKQARRYFISLERELSAKPLQLPAATTLAAAQQHYLKSAIEAKCKGNAKAYSACYRALYDAFKVPSYKDIPAAQFGAAMMFVANLQDSAPPQPPQPLALTADGVHASYQAAREVLNVTLDRLAAQLLENNSYPVEIFMPLWQSINTRLAGQYGLAGQGVLK